MSYDTKKVFIEDRRAYPFFLARYRYWRLINRDDAKSRFFRIAYLLLLVSAAHLMCYKSTQALDFSDRAKCDLALICKVWQYHASIWVALYQRVESGASAHLSKLLI